MILHVNTQLIWLMGFWAAPAVRAISCGGGRYDLIELLDVIHQQYGLMSHLDKQALIAYVSPTVTQ